MNRSPDGIPDAVTTGTRAPARPKRVRIRAWLTLAAGALGPLAGGPPAAGDDTELFVSDARRYPDARPNVLFIMDTSGSLNTPIMARASYDPAAGHPGRCDPARVYWRMGPGDPPACSSPRWFERAGAGLPEKSGGLLGRRRILHRAFCPVRCGPGPTMGTAGRGREGAAGGMPGRQRRSRGRRRSPGGLRT